MSARHRLSDPVDVKLYAARSQLGFARESLDNDQPLAALFHLAYAMAKLKRIEEGLDAADAA